ncbi:MAG TPA: hypothetical protein VFT31_14825 [Kribbella sp.]|nr:hypothetical protein [Kribbella sp.]
MDVDRVVETYVRSTGDRGSGFLVTGRLVLTAAHCVPVEPGAEVEIRRLNADGWVVAHLRWSGHDDLPDRAGIDAALVELSVADACGPDAGATVPFGTPIGTVDWLAVGFPHFDKVGGVTEDESASGRLDPFTKSRTNPHTGRREPYALDAGIRVRPAQGSVASEWAGMSGAAVIAEDHVVGVVVEEDRSVGGRLLGIPIEWVLSDPGAAALLTGDGRPLRPTPIWGEMRLLERPVRPFDRRDAVGPVSRAVMLQARRRAVDRIGRDTELETLLGWCQEPGGRPVRLVAGDAGVGKTRLGVELCVELVQRGWVSGFVAPDASGFTPLFELNADRLLVVDDALHHLDQLHGLLQDAESAVPVDIRGRDTWRVLVLARPPYDKWWHGFQNEFATLIDEVSLKLAPPSATERRQLYDAARRRFDPWVKADRQASPVPPDLDDAVYDSCTAIMERALLDADPRGESGGDPERNLGARLLRLEADTYWQPGAKAAGLEFDPELLERVVALCSMVIADGATANEREAAAARWLRVLPDLTDAPERTLRQVARWERGLYETGVGYLRPLRPHLLATEAAKRLAIDYPEVITDLLDFSVPELSAAGGVPVAETAEKSRVRIEGAVAQAARVLSTLLPAAHAESGPPRAEPGVTRVLERIVADRLDALVFLATEHARVTPESTPSGKALSLEALLADLLRLAPSPRRAAAVIQKMPQARNLKLDDLAVVLQAQAVTHYRDEADTSIERLADALRNLSVRQHDICDLDNARDSAQQAVDLRTELVARHADLEGLPPEQLDRVRTRRAVLQVRLASARANLANVLCDLNLRADAVLEASRAREVLQEVTGATGGPDTRHVTIEVVSNLSRALRRAGQRVAACQFAGQAEELAEELFTDEPEQYHHWYAIALRRHSAALSDTGDVRAAVEKAEEAVKHFDVMARREPDRWAYDEAKAHRNLAERLGDVARWGDAEREARRAVDLWKRLSSHRAAVYDDELAKATVILARAWLNLDSPDEAAQAIESIALDSEPLDQGARDTAAAGLAVKAEILLARHDDSARQFAQRSVELLQEADPEFGRLKTVHLARSLYVLAVCGFAADPASATVYAGEAERLCGQLRSEDPCGLPAVLRDARKRWNQLSDGSTLVRRTA